MRRTGTPGTSLIAEERLRMRAVSGTKPVLATEAGFITSPAVADADPPGGQPPTDEASGAVYTVRTVLEHYLDGISRTFLYELVDERADPTRSRWNYGLLRADFSPKPAFTALKNLLAMVGTTGPATLTPLQYRVVGDTADLRQLVIQQDERTYLIALWRTASVWNRDARQPLAVAPLRYAVSVPGATGYEVGDPLQGAGFAPAQLDGDRILVDVGANPVILRVRTRGAGGAAPPGAGTVVARPDGRPAAVDTRRPRLSRLRVKRVGRRYVAVFRLSEPARIGVRLDRARPGSRRRYRLLRRLPARLVRAGARSVTLGRRLKPGRHRVLLTARDAAGNEVRVVAAFRVRADRRR